MNIVRSNIEKSVELPCPCASCTNSNLKTSQLIIFGDTIDRSIRLSKCECDGVVMIMATVAAVVDVSAGKRFLLLGATSYYSDLFAEKLVCSAGDLPTNTNTYTSIITATAKKSRRPHSVKALKDPHSPCSLIHDHHPDEYLVDALLLLQKSMLEKQWNLAPETQTQKKKKKSEIDEVTCSGTSARRRRMESRRIRGGADDDEMMIPQWRRRRSDGVGLLLPPPHQKGGGGGGRGYYVSQQLLIHGEVVRLSHKIKAGLALEERRSRLKQRLGCEPSDEQLASSLRMSRASLQSRMIECSLAREKLAMSNIRLVMSIAQRHDNMGAEMPDLIQGGLIGLLRGIEKFDSSKGFKISTYVYWWIRQGVSRALVESSRTLRLPTHLHERLSLIGNAKARLEERGITPSIDRIAESLNMTERKVRNATEAVSKVFSLDREACPSLNGLPGETLHSYIADTHAENNPWTGVDKWALKDEVDKLINATLREREREIIRLYYGLDNECLTWEDISRRIGLSRERVRQVGLVALEKLKHAARKSGLEALLL